jgi:aryl-alcohol dehydrogenase-like predicted oxidoreductase
MRERVVLISKCAHPWPGQWEPRVTPAAIDEDLSASLDRLRVDAIDLYLLHRDDPSVPAGPLIERLNQQLGAGRITAMGASNWLHLRITEANAYAARRGLRGLVASSPQLALAVPNQPIWPDCVSIAGDAEALAWVLHQSPRTFAIVGPYTVAELEDCLDAQRVTLAPHERRWPSLDE